MTADSNRVMTQFIKFCVIGVSNTAVHLSIYYLLLWLNVYYLLADIIAFAISVWNSYFWNKKYTFDAGKTTLSTILRLYAAYGSTTLLGTGLLFIMVDVIGLDEYISPIIKIGVITVINFILNKYIVFKKRD